MRQVVPVPHCESEVHRLRHTASTQSEPAAQSPAFLQLPTGRFLQSPAWQVCVDEQSVSLEQPK